MNCAYSAGFDRLHSVGLKGKNKGKLLGRGRIAPSPLYALDGEEVPSPTMYTPAAGIPHIGSNYQALGDSATCSAPDTPGTSRQRPSDVWSPSPAGNGKRAGCSLRRTASASRYRTCTFCCPPFDSCSLKPRSLRGRMWLTAPHSAADQREQRGPPGRSGWAFCISNRRSWRG